MRPFHNKRQQKNFGIIATLIGIVIMLINPTIPVITSIISSLHLGLIIATIGLVYLLEAVS